MVYKKLKQSDSNLTKVEDSEGNSVEAGKLGLSSFDGDDEQRRIQGGVMIVMENANEVKEETRGVIDGMNSEEINTSAGKF